jgi:hypothetical protein
VKFLADPVINGGFALYMSDKDVGEVVAIYDFGSSDISHRPGLTRRQSIEEGCAAGTGAVPYSEVSAAIANRELLCPE